MSRPAERFCAYCQNFKGDFGFRFITDTKKFTKRGMCPPCQEKRKLPHSKLIEMAEQDKIDRKNQK